VTCTDEEQAHNNGFFNQAFATCEPVAFQVEVHLKVSKFQEIIRQENGEGLRRRIQTIATSQLLNK
jgi:hypothetical protein